MIAFTARKITGKETAAHELYRRLWHAQAYYVKGISMAFPRRQSLAVTTTTACRIDDASAELDMSHRQAFELSKIKRSSSSYHASRNSTSRPCPLHLLA